MQEWQGDLKDVTSYAAEMWANFGWLAMYKPLIDFCNRGHDAIPIDKVDVLVNNLLEANLLYHDLKKEVKEQGKAVGGDRIKDLKAYLKSKGVKDLDSEDSLEFFSKIIDHFSAAAAGEGKRAPLRLLRATRGTHS